MVLGFKERFKEPILKESKIHTIRIDEADRWRSGRSIQMATGVRTKNYNCFKETECKSTQHIFMTYKHNDIIQISVDDRELFGYHERLALAINDGFTGWQDFFNWFYPLIIKSENKWYSGKIIHWTDFKY